MKILAVATAFESQKFVSGYPPKGARLFLRPDVEIARLSALSQDCEFIYRDERVELIEPDDCQLAVVRVDFNQEESARTLAERFWQAKIPVVVFGPQVTAWGRNAPSWVRHRVTGDITLIWDRIRQDFKNGTLQSNYITSQKPHYVVPRFIASQPTVMNNSYQAIQFIRGCSCPTPFRGLCPEYLYYGDRKAFRSKEEIIGEVVSLPKKHIHLLDDDVALYPDYYYKLFVLLWRYHRHWTVNASDRIFDYPQLIRVLAKAGVKIIFLNETFLNPRMELALKDESMVKWLYRRVKYLQTRRILVGTRFALPPSGADYQQIAVLLSRIDLDFIEPRFININTPGLPQLVSVSYHPLLRSDEPAWLKSRFYAFDRLMDRFCRRPRRVGFYSTGRYLIPYSFAYRQNFLEGIPYP